MIRIAIVIALVLVTGCKSNRTVDPRVYVHAARVFTMRYTESRLEPWHVHATAAGNDCNVLLVETDVVMADAMVDALHSGDGTYDVYPGGVAGFSRDRAFRGVVYRDRTDHFWRFGVPDYETLARCH